MSSLSHLARTRAVAADRRSRHCESRIGTGAARERSGRSALLRRRRSSCRRTGRGALRRSRNQRSDAETGPPPYGAATTALRGLDDLVALQATRADVSRAACGRSPESALSAGSDRSAAWWRPSSGFWTGRRPVPCRSCDIPWPSGSWMVEDRGAQASCALEQRHPGHGQSRVPALVAFVAAGPGEGLVHVVAGDHAEGAGHAGLAAARPGCRGRPRRRRSRSGRSRRGSRRRGRRRRRSRRSRRAASPRRAARRRRGPRRG